MLLFAHKIQVDFLLFDPDLYKLMNNTYMHVVCNRALTSVKNCGLDMLVTTEPSLKWKKNAAEKKLKHMDGADDEYFEETLIMDDMEVDIISYIFIESDKMIRHF
ncbi:hypothetical protein A3Q56_03544 [Intoshia linei]|uniref:Uncharacterized protein n=1 Tax=Intoshia linei TaxID=1819745 RepID=A0A177B398_9BILA|nr:hypothetical protein A3Q56_03544 [Intoshia linei]